MLTKFNCTSKTHSNQSIHYLSTKRKSRVKEPKNPKGISHYSQTIDVYENLEDYNPTKKRKVLIMFDDMIVDIEANKQLSPIVTECFLRGRKDFIFSLYHNLIFKCLKL